MKLTNTIRDAFIRSVMNDVPSIDYGEQIRAAAYKAAIAALPPKIRAAWQDKELQPYINTTYLYVGGIHVARVPIPDGDRDAKKKLEGSSEDLKAKAEAQKMQRDTLESRLRQCAYGASTRKQLAEALPEFEKYLPPDEGAALRSLPAVANVVADFVKAGWPKGKRPQKQPA